MPSQSCDTVFAQYVLVITPYKFWYDVSPSCFSKSGAFGVVGKRWSHVILQLE